MKKQLLKELSFLLLAFVGFTVQLNAQTELTVTDVVETQTFTTKKDGSLTIDDFNVIAAGSLADNKAGYIRITAEAPFADHSSKLTFNLRSTSDDVTASIKFIFKK